MVLKKKGGFLGHSFGVASRTLIAGGGRVPCVPFPTALAAQRPGVRCSTWLVVGGCWEAVGLRGEEEDAHLVQGRGGRGV